MITKDKEIVFENDNEFYDFAVVQKDKFYRTESGILCHDFDFTKAYEKAVEEGKTFVIKDKNSLVAKNKCVTFRTITKPVDNVRS